ncbi:Protein CBG18634 [Caenorhabditis briggsae]|nr:Protein CBG18634 [Caenorhabditis briggsae]CAP36046.1 Protein CBG18634 [Caenorhabditis briggsae]
MAETIDESSEVIKNNNRSIMTCILYETIKKKPIFSSYRNFCKLVGNDAMDYPDFEFWYFRFYHKQLDFNYDRNMDPVPKTIMDMPVLLMYKITENLDTVERTYLRSMNKSLRDVADSHRLIFDRLQITVFANGLHWYLNDKIFRCLKAENGCTLYTPTKKIESDKSVMEMGLEYLQRMLKMANIQVHHLSLSLHRETSELDNFLPVPFHAKSVKLYALHMNQTFPFLAALNPGELESINLEPCCRGDREQMLRFFETEQFKQAKHVQFEEYLNEEDLLKFSHLKSFKCKLIFLEPVDFQRIREIISTLEVLESCELKYRDDWFPVHIIAQALEEEIPFGPLKTIKHSYPIPESNEHLEFEIEQEEYYSTIKIVKVR